MFEGTGGIALVVWAADMLVDGLPVGLQIMAALRADRGVLAFAAKAEELLNE